MTMLRPQYAQLLEPGAHHIFNQVTDTVQRALTYPAIFNVETSTKAYEDDIEFANMPPAIWKPENTPVTYQALIQGGTVRYIHLTYALGARASMELMDDDQYAIIDKVPEALARSMNFTKELTAWNIINRGFTLTTTTDGVSLFNNQHPLLGGAAATNVGPGLSTIISAAGTYPNRPAVDVDLSFAAMQLMTNHFERMVDAQGMPIYAKPKMVVAAPAQRFLLRELLGSPGKPGTATNEINSLLGEDLTYSIAHFLTADNPWFAFGNKADTQLRFFERDKGKMDMDDDFDTHAIKWKTIARYSAGASHWINTWGSNGP